MNKLDTVISQYKRGAATEIENDLILHWYPKRILQHLENSGVESLLELGVGHGHTVQLFNQFFQRHVILEGSPAVIDLFNETNDGTIEVIETYFEEFQTDEKFDVILMGFILEHVDDPRQIVERFKDFLVPGGKVFIAVPNAKSLNRRIGLELGMIDDIYELNEHDHALGHQRQFCLDSLKSLLVSSGYKINWQEGLYLKPLPLGHLQTLPRFEDNLHAMLEVGIEFPELCVGMLLEAQLDE